MTVLLLLLTGERDSVHDGAGEFLVYVLHGASVRYHHSWGNYVLHLRPWICLCTGNL